MSRRVFASITVLGDDDSQVQTIWEVADEDAAHGLRDQLGGQLGEPLADVVIGVSAAVAIHAAAVADGGFVAMGPRGAG